MVMHRRRSRKGGRLGSLTDKVWAAVSAGGQGTLDKMTAPSGSGGTVKVVSVTAAATTKKALKGKADPKAKLEKQLARGSECCPVIRTKCEMREVTITVKKNRFVKTYDYAKEKTVRSRVVETLPVKKKVRLCSVSAGKHQGDLPPPKEARQEKKMLAALLRAENCAVRTAGGGL